MLNLRYERLFIAIYEPQLIADFAVRSRCVTPTGWWTLTLAQDTNKSMARKAGRGQITGQEFKEEEGIARISRIVNMPGN